ncbi:MAG: universal stress protein [Cyanobacteria bacterium]|nr:universal stress protein [Cyanobacteriota bacterium]
MPHQAGTRRRADRAGHGGSHDAGALRRVDRRCAQGNDANRSRQRKRQRWTVFVSEAAPLQALLSACTSEDADLLVLGATGATGLRGLLIGSVAQGALDRSRTPVLIVR